MMPSHIWIICRNPSSITKERQTIFDLLMIKDMVESSVVQMKWVPMTLGLAKDMPMTDMFRWFLEGGNTALRHTIKEAEQDEHQKHHENTLPSASWCFCH